MDTFLQTVQNFVGHIPGFVLTFAKVVLSLAAYWVLLRLGRRIIGAFFQKLNRNRKVPLSARKVNTIKSLVQSIFKILLIFALSATIIHLLGLDGALASILATAGVGGFAIGFGAQSLVKDCITGFFMLLEDQITVGDIVKINGIQGTVESIQLRMTTIRAATGEVTSLPNGIISVVTNYSRGHAMASVDIQVKADTDIPHAIQFIREETLAWTEAHRDLVAEMPSPPVVIALPDQTVAIRTTCRVHNWKNWEAQQQLRCRFEARLGKEGIAFHPLKEEGEM